MSYIQQNGVIYEDNSIFNSVYKYPTIECSSVQIEQPKPKQIPSVEIEEQLEILSDNDSDTTIEDTQSCHKPPPSDPLALLDEEVDDLFSL